MAEFKPDKKHTGKHLDKESCHIHEEDANLL
jgi:hypothetical protein